MSCARSHSAGVIRVFVFLPEGFGATRWQNAWKNGRLPGICDPLPYGYFHAGNDHWIITYSEDRDESAPVRLFRRVLRRILGFDLLHAWYHRNELSQADVVWTHTEREYLAALCLWRLRPPNIRPKLIAQSIWLFDRWRTLSELRRRFYRSLMCESDVLTVLSPENLRVARRLFPQKRCELIRFGIDADCLRPATRRQFHRPIRILSLGTDMHRDWDTLVEAVRNWDEGEVRIASRTVRKLRAWPGNVTITTPRTRQEVRDLYDWADLVVVSLKPNLHASGITVIVEAVLLGLPVVCTDTGGLRYYFSEHELAYVRPDDAGAIRRKIQELAGDEHLCLELANSAQRRIFCDKLTSYAYAIRHRQLSESLLNLSSSRINEQLLISGVQS
jgi:glycosyltransferase involved in cell wall biosynthesis